MTKNTVAVVDDVEFVLTVKTIKNLYIRVKKDNKAYVSVPKRFTKAQVNEVLKAHVPWVKAQLAKLSNAVPKSVTYVSGEIHYLWGKEYPLVVDETSSKNQALIEDGKIILRTQGMQSIEQKKKILTALHRTELNSVMPDMLKKWEEVLQVSANEWRLKTMKTRWGTCNTKVKRIWMNTELAKYPFECFEYVLVHELVHLLERSHNHRFHALMTQFLPDWPARKKALNHLAMKLS